MFSQNWAANSEQTSGKLYLSTVCMCFMSVTTGLSTIVLSIFWQLIFIIFPFYFFKVYLFTLRVTGRMQAGEEQRDRERESQAGSTLSAQSPHGSITGTMRSWPALKSRVGCLSDWAIQVPLFSLFNKKLILTTNWSFFVTTY